jgi:ribose transport system permease protein
MDLTGNLRKTLISVLVLIVVIVVFAVVFNLAFEGKFLTQSNVNQILTNSILASFTAWGFCFVLALNYMDLSIGAVIMLCVYASGELGNMIGPVGVVIAGLVVGVVVMTFNFSLFAFLKIPSWVAGLGLALIYEAIISVYQRYKESVGTNLVMLKSEYGILGKPPLIYVMFAVGIVLAYILYNRSSLGLNARSVGSNPNVARTMGININRTLIMTGIVCGVFVGCAGFLRESYSLLVNVPASLSSLAVIFPPFAAIFIAQVISRWVNMIIAVPFCAIIIYICYNVLSIVGIPSGTISEFVLALFIIVFGMIAQRGTKEVVK